VRNPLLDCIRDAGNRNWCMDRYCTTCGASAYRNRLKQVFGYLGGPRVDALADIDVNELTRIHNWQSGLFIAAIDLPMWSMQLDGILRAWLPKAITNIPFADCVLFKIVRSLPVQSVTRREWISACLAIAIGSKDFSLVESLILVLGQDAKTYPELMSIAADHEKSSGQMRRVMRNVFNMTVRKT